MKRLSLLFLLSGVMNIYSQTVSRSVIASDGDYQNNGGYSLSYTIGEVCSSTMISGSYILTEGFQQTKLTVVGIKELEDIELSLFPNPSSDKIIIKINDLSSNEYQIKIVNLEGKVFYNSTLIQSKEIDISSFTVGNYVVHVSNDKEYSNTYSLIKL